MTKTTTAPENKESTKAHQPIKARLRFIAGKAALVIFLAGLLTLLSLAGFVIYLHYHPENIKPLIERTISGATRAECSIQAFSYTLHPLHLEAEGITLAPPDGTEGLSLRISLIDADLGLEGPFGRRHLMINSLNVQNVSIAVTDETNFAGFEKTAEKPGILSQSLSRIIAVLLFRDIQLVQGKIEQGEAAVQVDQYKVRFEHIFGIWSPNQLLETSFSVQGESRDQQFFLSIPDATISIEPAISLEDLRINGTLKMENGRIRVPDFSAERLRLLVPFRYQESAHIIQILGAQLELQEIQTPFFSTPNDAPLDARIETNTTFDLSRNLITAKTYQVQLADLMRINGSMSADLNTDAALNVDMHGWMRPQALIAGLSEELKENIPPFDLSGEVSIKGNVSLNRTNGNWITDPDLTLQFQNNSLALHPGGMNVKGLLNGSIEAQGMLPSPTLAARMEASNVTITAEDVDLGPSTVSLSFSGRPPLYTISNLTLETPSAAFGKEAHSFPIKDIHLKIQEGTFDSTRQFLAVPNITLDTSLLHNLNGSVTGPVSHIMFHMQGKNTSLLEAAKTFGLVPTDWQFEAHDQLEMTAALQDQRITAQSAIHFNEITFQNQAGTCLGEKIDTTITLKSSWDLRQSRLKADARVDLNNGEILLDRFYFNLAKNTFSARLAGADYRLSDEAFSVTGFDIDFRDILKMSAAGRLRLESGIKNLHVQINLPETPVNQFYEHFVLEPFKIKNPLLEKLALTGRISTSLTVEGDYEHLLVQGRCALKNGSISLAGNDFSLHGIELELPVWCGDLSQKDTHPDSLRGRLAISSISHPLLPEQSIDIPIEAQPNRLQFQGPIVLTIPGGAVRMDSMTIQDMLMPGVSVQTGMHLDVMEIEPLLSSFVTQPIEGTVQGDLLPIVFENGRIRTEGKIILNLFEGRVVIDNIGVDDLFSSFPVLRLDAGWQDLNLADMTTGTAFGKIEGILKGQVTDLEIANGQPQKFQLLVETEQQKDIRRRISVKAVENIAQLGGGGSPFMGLAGTFASLFKTFPYEKIGVKASLENDIFRINGLIKESNVEYIVKRSGFSGVNVVNQNPDNRIRFKDMVKRIKRITASDRGPVIE